MDDLQKIVNEQPCKKIIFTHFKELSLIYSHYLEWALLSKKFASMKKINKKIKRFFLKIFLEYLHEFCKDTENNLCQNVKIKNLL